MREMRTRKSREKLARRGKIPIAPGIALDSRAMGSFQPGERLLDRRPESGKEEKNVRTGQHRNVCTPIAQADTHEKRGQPLDKPIFPDKNKLINEEKKKNKRRTLITQRKKDDVSCLQVAKFAKRCAAPKIKRTKTSCRRKKREKGGGRRLQICQNPKLKILSTVRDS